MKCSLKKILSAATAFCIALSFGGCTSGEVTQGNKITPTPRTDPIEQTPITDYDSIQEITWLRVSDTRLSDYTREYLLLNFGLRVKEIHYSNQNMADKILLNYSAGLGPDIATGLSVNTAKRLADAGYLYDFYSDKDSISNYFSLWDGWQDGWEYTKKQIESADAQSGQNKLCYLVPVNRKSSNAWIYNKTVFEKNSAVFPNTVSELYDTLARYKRDNPKAAPMWISEGEVTQFSAILGAYGLTSDKWQSDANGNVRYLYAQKDWYKALEWLIKFEKAEFVPTDEKGVIRAYDSKEYKAATRIGQQIIDFTQSYNYMYLESEQKGSPEWAVSDVMISGEYGMTPALQSNKPYIGEAVCICNSASDAAKKQILAFLNWCCSEEGNMWVNFGEKDVGYTVSDAGEFSFLKYYSSEMTPGISKKESGSISDITIGRLFTTVPWETLNIEGARNRYSAEEEFLKKANYRLALPELFADRYSVLDNKIELWDYETIMNDLDKLTEEFVAFTRQNGCSDYYWSKYMDSLVDAGLYEYTAFMQKRKR